MEFTIAIHGGAGTIVQSEMSSEKEAKYKAALQTALLAGKAVLTEGGTAVDAVAASVTSLENCPLFNAGIGSVFTNDNTHEMDASIMDGKDKDAGAVSGVLGVKNPVMLAKEIMLHSDHVLLSGKQAYLFARERQLEILEEKYFFTPSRYEQWLISLKSDSILLDHSGDSLVEKKFGTVGAVALDKYGNLAAATSTGGMTNKRYGRIGDTPIIGSGTYANNETCAVSCTGHGEYFMRSVVAYDISCLIEYKGLTLTQACNEVVKDKLIKIGGEGGLIAVDKNGQHCLSFNSEGMYRGYCNSNNELAISIYKD
jgi:beta-aspartyl-peptidase (threonine type)